MRINSTQLITDGYMGANITGSTYSLHHMTGFTALAVVSSGSPTGTLKLQVSNDSGQPLPGSEAWTGVTNWFDVPGSSIAITAGALANPGWHFANCAYRWIRVVYTATSGIGTLQVFANAKGVQ